MTVFWLLLMTTEALTVDQMMGGENELAVSSRNPAGSNSLTVNFFTTEGLRLSATNTIASGAYS